MSEAVIAGSPPLSSETDTHRRHRESVDKLTPEQLGRFRQALALAQEAGANNGYTYWAGIHGLPLPIYGEHGNLLYLPWHRAYLHLFELALQSFVPGVALPYWDFSSSEAHATGIPRAYQEQFVDGRPNPLYSTAIDPAAYEQAQSGSQAAVSGITVRDPGGTDSLPTRQDIENALNAPSFPEFSSRVEQISNRAHMSLGGTMQLVTLCAYDPLNWAVYAMIDRLWDLWQRRHPDQSPPNDLLNRSLAPFQMTVADTLDLARLGYDYLSQSDNVPNRSDRPADVDELGRIPFARALVTRIRTMRDEEIRSGKNRPFSIHIHGPWGAGKTSLLNFMCAELKKGNPPEDMTSRWVVIDFNAWQHQRLGAPWWWMMDAMYRQGAAQLLEIDPWRSIRLRLQEYWWRFRVTRAFTLLVGTVAFAAVAVLLFLASGLGRSPGASVASMGDLAKSLSAVVALLLSVWTFTVGAGRWLLVGSSRGPETFMGASRDPMDALIHHSKDLVCAIGQPTAIFIDDIDRCQSSYVVDVLEGIQTLYQEIGVTYVIAGDRRWLRASYEKIYDSFADGVGEPGRPLGYLFIEKTFQLSASVPRMSGPDQKGFWERLIQDRGPENQEQRERERGRAYAFLQNVHTQEGILAAVQNYATDIDPRALREAAVIRANEPDIALEVEHALEAFAPLLEPNPRAMKRLVNAYGVQRDVNVLTGDVVEPRKLALWTILGLRWPLLAECLEKRPELIHRVRLLSDGDGASGNPLWPAEVTHAQIADLFHHPDVVRVVQGEGVGTSLDEAAIRACVSLKASTSTELRPEEPVATPPA